MKLWVLAVCVFAAGCDGSLPAPCANGSCGTQVSTRATSQSFANGMVDILFVVDDTAAMAPYQAAVATGMADIARSLTGTPESPSVHIGFVRAGRCNADTRGAACGIKASESFLRLEWCQTVTNAPAAFDAAFTCLADFGTNNCAPAQPLSMALEALSGSPRAGWEGFLRPDAFLLIAVVSAEDDASGQPGALTPVADLVARAKSLKADPYQIAVSVIGPGDCAAGDAPGPRLTEFTQNFGANGIYVGLCSGQLAAAVMRVGESINVAPQPACVTNVRDTDAATPGLQPDCTVVMTSGNPSGGTVMTTIPSCDDSGPPCWRLLPGSCVAGAAGYIASIESGIDWCFEAPTSFTVECLSCADPNDPACAMVAAR